MKCDCCGMDLKDIKFYKVYPTMLNDYYTKGKELFICSACLDIRFIKVLKVRKGYDLQDLEFTEYVDSETFSNELDYVQKLEKEAIRIQNCIKDIGDIPLRYVLENQLKEIKEELNKQDKEFRGVDV